VSRGCELPCEGLVIFGIALAVIVAVSAALEYLR
jgi:hypothetical protein